MYKTGGWGEQAKAYYKKRLESGYYKKRDKARYLKEVSLGIKHPQKYKKRFNGFGSKGELIALKILKDSVLVRKSGFDLIWNNKKIEVKISHFTKLGGGTSPAYGWVFNTKRQKSKTDYFFLICFNKKEVLEKIYFIPDNLIPKTLRVDINKNSIRFEKFLVKGGELFMSEDQTQEVQAEATETEATEVVEEAEEKVEESTEAAE